MKLMKWMSISVFSLLAITSCKKQLDLLPTDSLINANAFRTISDAQAGTNDAYQRYANSSFTTPSNVTYSYSSYTSTMYQSALLSDEGKLGKDNSGQGALTYRYQYSADATSGGDVTTAFGGYYYLIDQANRVLTALPNVIATPSEEPRRNILKGQLLALRAIAHFGILQSYCGNYNPTDPKGIAYMTSSDPAAKPARLDMTSSLTAIEGDLNTAFNLLPAVTAANFTDTVMNQVNINAYRARIALYKGDYANAITYSNFVISASVRPLATTANYATIWNDSDPALETLFRIRTGPSTAVGSLFTTTGGLIYIAPSDKLVNKYGTGDVRKTNFIAGTSPFFYVNKFFTSSRGGRAVDVKACRISEMYLIRAEANAKLATPNLTSAAADLNLLRSQRITGYVNATFATASILIDAILDERYKELCFEGFRFLDLKRNNLPVQRDLSDVTSATWQTLATGNYRFVLPIPQYEILANPNAIQNSGY
jgi:starch-binding outer membrane protein, SusD/RagB family